MAALARRSPPRLNRRRLVFPDDASTGQTPHRDANDASERRRSGLSPAVINNVAAVSGAEPVTLEQLGSMSSDDTVDLALQVLDLCSEVLDPTRQQPECVLARCERI